MTDDSNNKGQIPTNEELINDLLKDIPKQDRLDGTDLPTEFQNLSSDGSTTENDRNDEPTDSDLLDEINEDLLNELESTMTIEEKEQKKSEALELKKDGNKLFSENNYRESLKIYTKCLNLCPLSYPEDRSVYFSNRAACKYQLGHKKSAIEDCTAAIALNDRFIRAYLRRAKYSEEVDELDTALADYQKVLELDSSVVEAQKGVVTLPPRIQVKNEKLKEEMMGKLKDLGNLILKPFGLSTSNFQMTQNPETGGYSMNFKQ